MKHNQITIKGILIFSMLIIISSFVLAVTGVIQNDHFYDSSTGNDLTNVQSLFYSCNDNACNSIGNQIHNLNSGSTNKITFEYPYNPSSTDSNRDYYAHYIFKDCYLLKEYIESIWGYGVTRNYDYNFNKATSCHSPIDSFSITNNNYANEPIVINMQARLEADAHSAFTNLELEYTPAGYEDYYSAKTEITLEIFDDLNNIVYTETKTYEIFMDSSQNVEFTWTPTAQGDYSARVTTDVVDCQCESSFTQFSEKQFLVWPARPQDECYTIINDLEATPEFATQGDLVTIRFNKISNYADNSYVKTPVATAVTYEITNNGNIVYSDNVILSANSNPNDYQEISFQWVPSFGGDFNIKVTGVCSSGLCDSKTNPEDIAILGFFVKSIQTYDVTFVVTDADTGNLLNQAMVNFGAQSGKTNSAGEVVFKSNTGNYDWQVELSGYESESGNVNVVDSDVIVNVQLSEIAQDVPSVTTLVLDYPVGGETLKGKENILWTASNSENHTLLIDLYYSLDNGAWTVIAQNEINDGVYSWNTLNYPDDKNYLLRIKATDILTNLFVYEQTATTFEIANDEEDEPKKGSKASQDYPSEECISIWECSGWSECIDNMQTRNCIDLNNCEIPYNKPSELRGCDDLSGYSIIDLGNLNKESKALSAGTFLFLAIIFGIILVLIFILFILFRK